MSLKRLNLEKNTGYLFFRNPPLPQISTFSFGQKGCASYEKCAYYGCVYYEWGQYMLKYIIQDVMQVDQFTTQITGEITFVENFSNGSDPVTHTRLAFMDCPPQNGVQEGL